MEYYFNHPSLQLSPIKQTIVFIVFPAFKIFIFVLGIFLIFSEFLRLQAVGFLILLISITQILRHNKAPHDLRFEKYRRHTKVYLKLHLTKHAFWFVLQSIRKGLAVKNPDVQKIFLINILKEKDCQKICKRIGVSPKNLKNELRKKTTLEKEQYIISDLKQIYSLNVKSILQQANELAEKANYPYITTGIIFISIIKNAHPEIRIILEKLNIRFADVYSAFLMETYQKNLSYTKKKQPLSKLHIFPERKRLLNRALTAKFTPTINQYGQDLTYIARKGEVGFLIGHKKEVSQILDILSRNLNRKVILVGENGSGRTSIIWHIAWLIEHEKVPKELLDYRLVELDLTKLLSGEENKTKEIIQNIINEILSSEKIILFLKNLAEISSSLEGKEIITVFMPIFQSQIPIISLTNNHGLSQLKNVLPVKQMFEVVTIKPLNEEESITFLSLEAILWEKEHKIIISPQAISRAVFIASDLIKDKPLPKSAEDLLLSTITNIKRKNKKYLSEEEVASVAETLLGIPVKKPLLKEKEILLNLEERMHERIVNQEEAIKELARVLRIYRTGLAKKSGPIGVFLFVGPTGVGKTETAKTLSKIYFPESEMLRLDMVEFQTAEDIEKLIGSTDGEIIGALTEPVRQNPYRVILLDEFEKTHPTLMKLFLPIFDEGKIKDAVGREVDFKHTIIIATSNAYSENIKEWLKEGLTFEEIKNKLKDKLSRIFSIELLNRFDNVIVYKPLGEKELIQIAQIMINNLKNDLQEKHKFELNITENALKEIVRQGTDPIFGARPLKRAIDKILRAEIAKLILQNKIEKGSQILIDFQDKFIFKIT